jgi:uncharacterized RDD family membrane protein YckC
LSSPDDKPKPAPPQAPKSDRTTQRVPSFAELHGPTPELNEEEKTTQITPELLKRALAESQVPPRTSSSTQTKQAPGPLPPPPRVAPAAPAASTVRMQPLSRPGAPAASSRGPVMSVPGTLAIAPEETAFPDERTAPEFERPRLPSAPSQGGLPRATVAPSAQQRRVPLEPQTLDATPERSRPAVDGRGATQTPGRAPLAAPPPRSAEGARPTSQRPPPPEAQRATPYPADPGLEDRPALPRGSAARPEVQSVLTDRVSPMTPDLHPGPKISPGRPASSTVQGAPAAPMPERSRAAAQPPPSGRRDKQPFGVPDAGAGPGEPPEPAHLVTHTQPNLPPYSPRGAEPASGDHRAAALPPEGPTRSERISRGGGIPSFDLGQQIDSELRKMPQTDPGTEDSGADDEVPAQEMATGRVDPLEIVASPASLWRRMLALVIDAVLLLALLTIVSVVVLILGRAPRLPDGLSVLDMLAVRLHDSPKLCAAVAVMGLGIATSYATLFAASFKGRTLGRTLLDITLVDKRGATPSPVRALFRAVFSVVSFVALFAGFWWSLFDRRGQTLHDKVCATYVVRFGARRT